MTKLAIRFQALSKFLREFSKFDSSSLGELGRGAGKGGGGGGPIREAGGPFGKAGAAREEEYYYKLQKKILSDLKEKIQEENSLREQEIETHQRAIEENKKMALSLEEKFDDVRKRFHVTNRRMRENYRVPYGIWIQDASKKPNN